MNVPSPIDASWYRRPEGIAERTNAGGVVARSREGGAERGVEIILIREGEMPLYALPKGGVHAGETPAEAARREIAEETGLDDLREQGLLAAAERLNFKRSRWATTHYFLFVAGPDAPDHPRPTDPTHRDLPPPRWFDLDGLPAMLWPEQAALLTEHRDRIVAAVHGRDGTAGA